MAGRLQGIAGLAGTLPSISPDRLPWLWLAEHLGRWRADWCRPTSQSNAVCIAETPHRMPLTRLAY